MVAEVYTLMVEAQKDRAAGDLHLDGVDIGQDATTPVV